MTCCKKEKKPITAKWKPYFPKNTSELEYTNNTPYCSYEFLLNIIKNNDSTLSVNNIGQLKDILIEEYSKLDNKNLALNKIFVSQGKKQMGQNILIKKVSLETAIMSDDYYISNYDIQLLAKHFKLPIILISSTNLKENNKPILVLNKSDRKMYYFIKVLPSKIDMPHSYRLFMVGDSILINAELLSLTLQQEIRESEM